jgi:nitric oxide dioxygenase
VKLAEYDLLQPQQFKFENQQNDQYQINVKNEDQPSAYSVQNTLIKHYRVGDSVQISAPVKL